jgi:hypothetical protein
MLNRFEEARSARRVVPNLSRGSVRLENVVAGAGFERLSAHGAAPFCIRRANSLQ